MLVVEPAGVAFRHELARLAVEESVPPHRKAGLHRRALAALADPPAGAPDPARLAHHAEAAGDADAVLRLAPAAAARAATLGAYREAAAQYGRALRFGDRLPLARRAELLERRSSACYLTDQNDAAIEAIEEALACRRRLGQRLEEGDSLRWLSQILWCPGRTMESDRAARAAVTLLEALPPGRELAMAYANLANTCAAAGRREEAVSWAGRALELARRLGDTEIAVNSLATIGCCEFEEGGRDKLERSLELALRAGLAEQVGRAYILLVGTAAMARCHGLAARYAQAGIDYCSDRGLERDRLYLLAYRARLELDQGRWEAASASAAAVLRVPRTSITPRIHALVVLGLVRGRSRRPAPRRPGWRATATASPRRPGTPWRSPSSWARGRRPASWPAGAGAPASAASPRPGLPSRTPSSSPATRRAPPSAGRSWAARTRRRSPWPTPTRRRRCGGPWTSCGGWGPKRPPTWWAGGCERSACGGCRAVPAGPRRPTRPGSPPASSRCSPCSRPARATPRSPPACTSPPRPSTTTSRRSWPSSVSGRGATPPGSRPRR
jgi:tetratricopeptide (TPR) repeat protein